jgi:hypothetical protein
VRSREAELCQRRQNIGPRVFGAYLTGGLSPGSFQCGFPILTDYLVDGSPHSGAVAGFVGSDTWITKYLSGCSMLALREMACNALGGS